MLKQRVITALLMLFGLLAAVFLLPQQGWLVFTALIMLVAATEWAGLIHLSGMARHGYALVTVVLFVVAALASGLWQSAQGESRSTMLSVFGAGVAFWMLVAPLWLSVKWPLRHAGLGAVVGWLVIVPAGVALVVLRGIDPWLLLAAMAVVWVADIAAYFVGRAVGKRKLAPSISPGKSWEGAIGAVGFVVLYGFIVAHYRPEWVGAGESGSVSPLRLAAILVVLTAVSIVGDLFESLAKRQAGVKDSGTILPGHGGVLDRIDSLTSALPLVALALLWTKS